jgi:hypothetical protein
MLAGKKVSTDLATLRRGPFRVHPDTRPMHGRSHIKRNLTMTMKYAVAIVALVWATSASAQQYRSGGFFGGLPSTSAGPIPGHPGYACPINMKCDGKNIRPLDPNTPPVARATKAQRMNRQRLEALR